MAIRRKAVLTQRKHFSRIRYYGPTSAFQIQSDIIRLIDLGAMRGIFYKFMIA